MPQVSVIVPVFNPGGRIDACIASLLRQSMRDVELIFVDDGSTDGTPARLDELAARHPQVRVEHIPNSGWPGRPRNVGLELASGDFVYFVDNDDWIADGCLARLHATALQDDADIVIGKVVGHGKAVPRALFERNLHGVGFDSPLLLGLLTPHKLFRRAFLNAHGLRFPEGRRRLEDHRFVVEAYFRAARISVVADQPCYHWIRHDDEINASYGGFEAEGYYENLAEVLDLVEAETEPGRRRDALLLHWYRQKMLGRLGGALFVAHDPEYRRELYDAVRRLALDRFPETLEEQLPFLLRLRARLMRNSDFDALLALAKYESALGGWVITRRVRGDGTHLVLRLRSRLSPTDLRFRREGERVLWVPPPALREALAGEDLDVTDALNDASVQCFLHSPEDKVEYLLSGRTDVGFEDGAEPGLVRPVLRTTARVTPTTAAAGAPLPAGRWHVHTIVDVLGFTSLRRVRQIESEELLVLTAAPPARVVLGEELPPPPSRRKRVLRRAPWIGRTFRRTRSAVAAAVRA